MAESNRFSSIGDTPRMGSTTCLAQAKYSALRSGDQSIGGDSLMSRTLQILSASFTSFADVPLLRSLGSSIFERPERGKSVKPAF
jgi:hypothetical protein